MHYALAMCFVKFLFIFSLMPCLISLLMCDIALHASISTAIGESLLTSLFTFLLISIRLT